MKIMENWKEYKIMEICDVGSSKRIYASDYTKEGIPFFRSKEIIEKANNQQINEILYINKKKYKELDDKFGTPKKKDILLASIGVNMGIPYYVNSNLPFYFKDGNVTWFKNFIKDVESKYLYYWLKSSKTQEKLDNIAIGSAQKALTIESLRNLKINLPTLQEQVSIAEILFSIDNKIELNQNMNKILEQIGQTLFQRWFVDFNFPDDDYNPYKKNGGTLKETPMGNIPKKWKIGRLSNIANVHPGFAFKAKDFLKEGSYGIIKIKNINSGTINLKNVDFISHQKGSEKHRYEVNVGDILIAMTGATIGKIGIMPYTEHKYLLNQRVGNIKISKELFREYIYYLTKNEYFKHQIKIYATGAAQPNISDNDIEYIPIIIPDETILKKFHKTFSLIFSFISTKNYENVQLGAIRDILLPRLMSGEIRVPVEED